MEFKDQKQYQTGMSKLGTSLIKGKMEPALMEVETKTEQIPHGAPQSGFESKMKLGQRSSSLESEIDAENHARLQSMSLKEIARAEIMQKMDPALLKLLRKRGQEKLKNQASTSSDQKAMAEVGMVQDKSTAVKNSNICYNATKATSEASQRKSHNAAVENFSPASTALWNVWSERVEAVGRSERVDAVGNLRFSLEGDAIENGNLPLDTMYNADNVTERDFLRTEGDPGAAGYTIKEAVVLTRSVQKHISGAPGNAKGDGFADWEAIWAFALSPEPDLALTLRICLDDNHNSIILACAKKMANFGRSVCTVPVFQSRPEIDVGFLHGGFWKYNTKTSNVFISDENVIDESEEGQHTIKHDVIVSGQDVAIGFVWMGILPRIPISTIIWMDPSTALEELLLSISIAIARQPPTGTNAILKCPRLVQTIASRFTGEDNMANLVPKKKFVSLLKIFFSALCLWLNLPTFEKLVENIVLNEFASIATEAHLVLDALAGTLLDFGCDRVQGSGSDDMEIWCWNHVPLMVALAVKWLTLALLHEQSNSKQKSKLQDTSVSSLLWVVSAVLNMLATVIERVALWDDISEQGEDKMVEDRLLKPSLVELKRVVDTFRELVASDWQYVEATEDQGTESLLKDYLLQLPVLKCLDTCARDFLLRNRGTIPFSWMYRGGEPYHSVQLLTLNPDGYKSKAKSGNSHGEGNVKNVGTLDTIPKDLEGPDMRSQSLVVEWAHQRLPLPMHWFLSPISTISDAMSFFLTMDVSSPVRCIIDMETAFFVCCLVGMGILEEERSRDTYEVLQELCGKQLDKLRPTCFFPEKNENLLPETRKDNCVAITLVEQFAAISYGDLIYGRQVGIYLHRHVETPVRLAALNALSNARVLELLPPLESCCSEAKGYLEPVEVPGALDKAASRGSVAFRLSLQHKLARSHGANHEEDVQLEGYNTTVLSSEMPCGGASPE
ncbi:LOW QUALITY PROTEIN: RNA polymerase II-associated protein 1, N-terminal [Dillenia turbinata]|uniref:RNA polymerase II-associated protein 1, N-terminal n=1 Tax=Dillenia turbinata TaxID=194707 RepID=A0AAN8WDS6_9MAGN